MHICISHIEGQGMEATWKDKQPSIGKANPNVQAVHEVKRFEPFREG